MLVAFHTQSESTYYTMLQLPGLAHLLHLVFFVFFFYFFSITFSPCLVEMVWGWVACASCSINFMILEQQM